MAQNEKELNVVMALLAEKHVEEASDEDVIAVTEFFEYFQVQYFGLIFSFHTQKYSFSHINLIGSTSHLLDI